MTAERWELAPENAHQVARKVLKSPFFWDIADDGAPLGSDTGADTLAYYREWRAKNPSAPALAFVENILTDWDIRVPQRELIDERELKAALQEDDFSLLTHDDFMIALAFAQLVLEGRIEPEIRDRALQSIQRQATSTVIDFRGWVGPKERRSRLAKMREAIELARQLEG